MRNPAIFAFTLLIGACAQSPTKPQEAAPDERVNCLRETGSRIEPPPGDCNNNPGRVVTREEMERSGAFTTRDAIRRSVPQAR
jgi:hypothetical protein